ncbi:MAG: hypothetical protein QG578_366 [Thermodesulfobacteriota bacterium]|nr:hypothetical protein [Thermodesulfobacteriota bacterium]
MKLFHSKKNLPPIKNNVPAPEQEFLFWTRINADYHDFKYRLKADRLKAVKSLHESLNLFSLTFAGIGESCVLINKVSCI